MLHICFCKRMGKILDEIKEKAKDVKDALVDTTKDVAEKSKDTVAPDYNTFQREGSSESPSSTGQQDRRYEEGGPGTDVNRNDDPLTEYREKEPMTPAKIKEHEPTAVKRPKRPENNVTRSNRNRYRNC